MINNLVSYFFGIFVTGLLLSSCATSKSVVEHLDSYEYGIKKIHSENRNSTYDNLVNDYYETLKTEDEKFAEALAKDTLIHMSKGSCLGNCPVYSITLYNNGKVKYDGVSHVDITGIFESKLSEPQKKKVKELISKIELTKMHSKYPAQLEMISDVARTKMLISNGYIKFPTTISYDEPQELKDIESYLNQLIKEISWVQI